MRTYYIYKTTNTITNKSYIGQHEIPLNHEAYNRYLGSGIAIKAAIKKYGKENFIKEIIEYIEDDDKHEKVSEQEKYWIVKEKTMYPNGYNISPGGEGGITSDIAQRSAATRKKHGYKCSEETKRKMSEASKGKKKSEKHKQNLSEHHHLRTLHKILYENGSIEETYLSMAAIAKQHGTTQNTLLRYSAQKEFINGVYLLNIDPNQYECCSYKKDKEKRQKLCFDPIAKEVCTLCALRLRKNRNKESYKHVMPNDCIMEEDK